MSRTSPAPSSQNARGRRPAAGAQQEAHGEPEEQEVGGGVRRGHEALGRGRVRRRDGGEHEHPGDEARAHRDHRRVDEVASVPAGGAAAGEDREAGGHRGGAGEVEQVGGRRAWGDVQDPLVEVPERVAGDHERLPGGEQEPGERALEAVQPQAGERAAHGDEPEQAVDDRARQVLEPRVREQEEQTGEQQDEPGVTTHWPRDRRAPGALDL